MLQDLANIATRTAREDNHANGGQNEGSHPHQHRQLASLLMLTPTNTYNGMRTFHTSFTSQFLPKYINTHRLELIHVRDPHFLMWRKLLVEVSY